MGEAAGGGAGYLTHLGGDVWLAGSDAPAEMMIGGRPHFRFMDRLMIPGPTSELELDSIVAINRWRERLLDHPRLPHRTLVRRVVTAALIEIGAEGMIELGCGKFPLQPELCVNDYAGVDIDSEAVQHCRRLGLSVAASPEGVLDRAPRCSAVVALFAFQFRLAASTVDLLRRTRDDCVALVNVPTKDPGLVDNRLRLFADAGMKTTRIEFDDAHDRLLIAGRAAAAARCQAAAVVTEKLLGEAGAADEAGRR